MSIVRSDLLVLLNKDSHSMAMHCTVTVVDTKISISPNEAPWLILITVPSLLLYPCGAAVSSLQPRVLTPCLIHSPTI